MSNTVSPITPALSSNAMFIQEQHRQVGYSVVRIYALYVTKMLVRGLISLQLCCVSSGVTCLQLLGSVRENEE